jgi:iron complex outermembrane receptor protein
MNGFKNVAPVTQPLPDLEGTFKPQQANQYEGGIKADMFNHKLNLTASYYDILVENITRPASIERDGTTYNYTIQDGSQRSKGIDVDLSVMPFAGLNIIAGYGYNKSEMEKSDKNIQGRRPVGAGPGNLANLWLSYTTQGGKLQGFGAGFGLNYADENIITNDERTGIFTLPSYTVLNAAVFYNMKSYRIAVKADNIADKEYFGGWTTVEKQMPRRYSASIAVRF